jgi:hypothetical protein
MVETSHKTIKRIEFHGACERVALHSPIDVDVAKTRIGVTGVETGEERRSADNLHVIATVKYGTARMQREHRRVEEPHAARKVDGEPDNRHGRWKLKKRIVECNWQNIRA